MAGRGERRATVVVIGGGVAGSLLAKIMQHDTNVILIDQKDYLEIPWAELRSMVEPSFANRSLIYHSEYLTSARIVTSDAVSISEHAVQTANGESINYDYLVIATGHSNSTAGKHDRLRQFERDNQKISSSRSILIIGGGPTGVELAGEIVVDHPDKKVTIVHKGKRLLEFLGERASDKALRWLTLRKVDVIFQQTIDLGSISDAERIYTTSAGEKIRADIHFVCVGKPLSSSWLLNSFIKESLDDKGRVMVDEFLRVKGHTNIFAIGDITDVPEIKQGYLAHKHAEVVRKNLKLLIHGGSEAKLQVYKTSFPLAIVSLGRKDALAQFPFLTIMGCLPGLIKSGDLFVGKTRKQMGLNA